MKRKMNEKWVKKANCERVNDPNNLNNLAQMYINKCNICWITTTTTSTMMLKTILAAVVTM